MKRRFLSLFLILIISMLGLVSCNVIKDKVYDATGAEYFEFVLREDGNYALTAKSGATLPEKVKFPAEYNGKPVVEIKARAFKNNNEIKEVIIPVGYEIIGVEAFAYCTKLSSLTIGQQGGTTTRKTTIRASAFQGCSALATVTLGECVEVIDSYAFYETMITALNSRGLTKVGYRSFGNCTSLKTFYIPASLENVDESAFEGSNNVSFTVSDSNKVYGVRDGELVRK